MPNIAKMLKDEFARLGRREANRSTAKLKTRIAALEKVVRVQRTTLQALGRQVQAAVGRVERTTTQAATPTPPSDGSRLSPRLIRSLRKRLRLSQTAFAQLTGVTHVAVYLWESGKTKPRGSSREAILGLRSLGGREAKQRIEDLNSATPPSKVRKRGKQAAKHPRLAARVTASKTQRGARR